MDMHCQKPGVISYKKRKRNSTNKFQFELNSKNWFIF